MPTQSKEKAACLCALRAHAHPQGYHAPVKLHVVLKAVQWNMHL